jgi:hypothetical protein
MAGAVDISKEFRKGKLLNKLTTKRDGAYIRVKTPDVPGGKDYVSPAVKFVILLQIEPP